METVFRYADAVAAHGEPAVRRSLRRGLWHRPVRGVVVTHNATLTENEESTVSVAVAAPEAALAGLSSLAADGFSSPVPATVTEVVLPEGARRPKHPRTRYHWSTKLDAPDVLPIRSPRRTSAPRSTIDAASWATTDRAARAIVIAAFQQRLVSIRVMREALTRRGTCKRRALIVQSLLDAQGGIQSLPERDFDTIRRARGLPPPTRQTKVKRDDGRYYLDVAWDELGVAVEIHGVPHLDVERWDADVWRANEIVIGGRRLLIFTSYAIRHEPEAVGDQLVRILRSAGWTDDEASAPPAGSNASSSVPA